MFISQICFIKCIAIWQEGWCVCIIGSVYSTRVRIRDIKAELFDYTCSFTFIYTRT